MKNVLQAVMVMAVIGIVLIALCINGFMIGNGNIKGIKLVREAPPEPVAYARRIIVEWPDGRVRLVRFALLPNGEMRWEESEPNPYRDVALEAQLNKQKARESAAALEKQRRAMKTLKRSLPKVQRTETNALADRPLTWKEMKDL